MGQYKHTGGVSAMMLGPIADAIPLMLFIKEVPSFRVLFWNREAERVTGIGRAALVGRTGSESFMPAEMELYHAKDREVVERRALVETEEPITVASGETRWLRTRKVPLFDESGAVYGILGISIDITEERRAQEALAGSEARHRAVLESAIHAVIGIDEHGTASLWNRSAERIFGWAADEIVGREMAPFIVPPELLESHRAALRRAAATDAPFPIDRRIEITAQRRDGSRFPVELALARMGHGFVAFVSDISAQNAAQAAQRMDALGRLAGGVAHDFNNLMSVVMASADVLSSDEADPERAADIETIRHAADRASQLTRQLLAFSRKDASARVAVDMRALVRRSEAMFRRIIGEDIRIATTLTSVPAVVLADPLDLEQILLNLVVNARDAMERGGVLTLEVARGGTAARPSVVVIVSDTGAGMSAATIERVFDPFFTTKAPGEGTGLGLATVQSLVQKLDGHVRVASQPGVGTRFEIELPEHSGTTAAEQPQPSLAPSSSPAHGTLLLVEDEPAVRRTAARSLRRHGYTVLEADGAQTAIELFERHAEEIELVVTDVIMPSMSGRELADHLRRRAGRLPILYVSGYTSELVDAKELAQPSTYFLAKPFTVSALTTRVGEILSQARPASAG